LGTRRVASVGTVARLVGGKRRGLRGPLAPGPVRRADVRRLGPALRPATRRRARARRCLHVWTRPGRTGRLEPPSLTPTRPGELEASAISAAPDRLLRAASVTIRALGDRPTRAGRSSEARAALAGRVTRTRRARRRRSRRARA